MRAVGLSNRWIGRATLLGLTTWGLACGETSTQPTIDSIVIQAARSTSEGSGDPEVVKVDPPDAPQDTRLEVTVTGSGFDKTAKVEMLLNEESTDDITTNSTKFVNSKRLRADITIAANAAVDLFDVEVTVAATGGGRKRGIGIELFEVTVTTVELGGRYFSIEQDIDFQENGRRVVVRTEDGAQIDYSINITLDFAAASCAWSGFAGDTEAKAKTFWDNFPFAATDPDPDPSRNLLFRVNKKALGEPAGEHRTEARWWVQDEDIGDEDVGPDRVMYLVKVGVPGDLADQLSDFGFQPAIGRLVDNGNGTKTVTITGGAVRLSRHNCGDPVEPEATAGCGPQAPTLEVACVNPTSGDFQQVFTATVTIP